MFMRMEWYIKMVIKLREKITEYVSKNSDIQRWESVREMFGAYSYLMFLFLCSKSMGKVKNLIDMCNVVKNRNLERDDIVDEIIRLKDAEKFVRDIDRITDNMEDIDIAHLYQEYISEDFILHEDGIDFENGKNGRDILGAYYTQNEFAEIIARKAVDDYFRLNPQRHSNKIKIADYSCGGASFLIPILMVCQEKGINAEIYGYDVDPVAVVISRFLMIKIFPQATDRIFIILGNPLLEETSNYAGRFKKAIQGRYYNREMGIKIEDQMDIVLGNPPWEKIRFEEKKFLHHYIPDKKIGTKSDREKLLHLMMKNNAQYYTSLAEDYEAGKVQIKKSNKFQYSGSGELNTYALFTELSSRMIVEHGIVSLIVKSSLFKMPVYSSFFKYLIKKGTLYEIFMFVNKNRIFNIDAREEFSVLYLAKGIPEKLKVVWNLRRYENFDKQPGIPLSYEELNKLNPETGMIPGIKNIEELKFLLDMADRHEVFGKVYSQCHFGRLVHLTNHSSIIKREKKKGYLAVYEGKFIELYTGKFATFARMTEEEKYKNKATAKLIEDPQGTEYPEARFFIKEDGWEKIVKNFNDGYVIAWRSLTSATNRRTMLATVLPLIPACQSIQLLQLDNFKQMLHVLALFNSIVFDYMVRLKMVGLDLTQAIIKQIPVPAIKKYDEIIMFKGINATVSKHLLSRIRKLYENDDRIIGMFQNMDIYGVDEERMVLIADIDKIIAKLYGISDQKLKEIALDFHGFYTKEEVDALY